MGRCRRPAPTTPMSIQPIDPVPSSKRSQKTRRVALAAGLLLVAPLLLASTPPVLRSADDLLAVQPPRVVERFFREGLVMLASAPRDTMAGRVRQIEALVLFDRRPEEVLALLVQTERQAEYQPDLESSITLARLDDGNLDEHTVHFAFRPFVYHVRHHWDRESGRLWWELDESHENDVLQLEGAWHLHPLDDGRTLGRYVTRVDAGRVIPAFVQDLVGPRMVAAALERARLWIDSDGTYRP